jgi:hypothetical protein
MFRMNVVVTSTRTRVTKQMLRSEWETGTREREEQKATAQNKDTLRQVTQSQQWAQDAKGCGHAPTPSCTVGSQLEKWHGSL